MVFDIGKLLRERAAENVILHDQHVNPQLARVLRTIGFDKSWVRGEGPYLYDLQGRQHLDMLAGYGVFNVGRNHPTVRKALVDFLAEDHASLVQIEAPLASGILAEELKKRVPASLDTVYFTSSGTEGIETAIKFARCATGRPRVLYCDRAFHGLTNGSLSLNGDAAFRDGFAPFLPGCDPIALNDLAALEAELSRGDVAAFVVEPIQGKGVFIATDEFLRGARALLTKHGALFVLDEVQTGLGRTGKLFGWEHSGVVPDLLVLSKALSGGYVPVGAVLLGRETFLKVFSSRERCVVHSSTFGQGALAMVAGLASLHVIDEEKLVESSRRMGDLLVKGLLELKERFELVREIRGRGLMIGIEFGRPTSFRLRMGWDLVHKLHNDLFAQAIIMPLLTDHAILTQVAGHGLDVIKLIPPLVIGEADVARFLEAFKDVLGRCHHFPGPIWEVTTRLARHALKR
ncbi:MAG TPA: aspartate aminotransferase family protein [Planctomycetota bacterium]|nr:aspartate aminotransferase family protein [Planctomycetota bacterium]